MTVGVAGDETASRPRLRAAAAVAGVLVLLVAGGLWWASTRPSPVRFDADEGSSDASRTVYAQAGAGQRPVFGALGVTDHGDRPATLVDARLTGPADEVVDGGARLAQVLVRDASAGVDYLGAAPDWPVEPYARDAVPLAGYELAPGARAEILFVVAIDEEGHWFWPRSEVTYTVKGRRYRDSTSTGFLICPPGSRTCERPGRPG